MLLLLNSLQKVKLSTQPFLLGEAVETFCYYRRRFYLNWKFLLQSKPSHRKIGIWSPAQLWRAFCCFSVFLWKNWSSGWRPDKINFLLIDFQTRLGTVRIFGVISTEIILLHVNCNVWLLKTWNYENGVQAKIICF